MKQITEEMFTEAVGRAPKDDDLDRCNCPEAGDPGHRQCGWSEKENLPRFLCQSAIS